MTRPSTLVWIDAREAVIVRWADDRSRVERIKSDVPAHHRATGHVRHDPAVRHGGGRPQTAGEPHRLELLKRFVEDVADRTAPDDDLLILGPGVVRERLARRIRELDDDRERSRSVTSQPAMPATDRQLIARLRQFAGAAPRRRAVGAYRGSEPAGPD
ncbi:MAG: hypothetical protein WEE50_03170 [Chloroflexota bacterium]